MIICFSGTGNSLAAANKLAALARDKVFCLGEPLPIFPALQPDENVIWVMPCHSWGMPKWVKKLLRHINLPGAETCRHHLVMTCGDDIGLAHIQWRKSITRRGWKPIGTYSVTMPNTYVTLPGFDTDSATVTQQKLDRMPERISRIWHSIKCNARVDDVTRGSMPWLKTNIVYPLFMQFLTSPKPFHATDQCIGCGKCSRICPLSNIAMHNNKPQWSHNCTLCLGCYHACPTHAIAYGKATLSKGQKQPIQP